MLEKKHNFTSYEEKINTITDSEVIVHMVSEALEDGMRVSKALKEISAVLKGSFLVSLISTSEPELIWIANWYQPCYIGLGKNEAMFCSSFSGFQEIKEELDTIFQPKKNSLITLSRKGVKIEPLDITRDVPELFLIKNRLKEHILNILEDGETNIRALWKALNPEGWADSFRITIDEWNDYVKKGVSIVNPYIEVLDELIFERKIRQRIDLRVEGGVKDTPRFSYFIP
jgi:hypothetical protein